MGENKQITELLPGILNQLGAESLTHLKKLASNVTGGGAGSGLDGAGLGGDDDDDDDVPDLVENFDEVSKNEANAKTSRVEDDDAANAADDEDDDKKDLEKSDNDEKKAAKEKSVPKDMSPMSDSS